jgi:hypothetical protein
MPRFRLETNRTDPRPDRRLGIKLESPTAEKRLGGKLDAYVPPELLYEYKPPSVFVRYKGLTVAFLAVFLGLTSYWAYVLRHPSPPRLAEPPSNKSAPTASPAQKPQDQPIYIEPLPAK